jgi:hypothetical protein
MSVSLPLSYFGSSLAAAALAAEFHSFLALPEALSGKVTERTIIRTKHAVLVLANRRH